ncbi:MAG: hypothetical protein ABI702_23470 [Burkholderiales bacterium]
MKSGSAAFMASEVMVSPWASTHSAEAMPQTMSVPSASSSTLVIGMYMRMN